MCLEDFRMGVRTTGNLYSVTLTSTDPTLLVGGSVFRRTLILFPHPTAAYQVRFNDDTNSPSFNVPAAGQPIKFNRDKDGDIVSRPLYISTVAGSETIAVYAADFHPTSLKALGDDGQ